MVGPSTVTDPAALRTEEALTDARAERNALALLGAGSTPAGPGTGAGAAPAPAANRCRTYTPTDSSKLVVDSVERDLAGVSLRNWADPGVLQFSNPRPGSAGFRCRPLTGVDEFVIHETAGNPPFNQQNLDDRGLSIHFVIHDDGRLTQHNDVVERLIHGNQHNPRSIGVEIVNRIRPIPAGWPTDQIVEHRQGKGTRRITIPSQTQCETLVTLLRHLVDESIVPDTWMGHFSMGGREYVYFQPRASLGARSPGVYAHDFFRAHDDGKFPYLYAWLRMGSSKGYGPDDAYRVAKALCEAAAYRKVGKNDYPLVVDVTAHV